MFEIVKYKELDSTNKFALENIYHFKNNTIIQAEVQTEGRGRFTRKWVSDKPNNCYVSFVLKPDLIYQNNFPNLTQYLSVVLCEVLFEYGIKPEIKWPNDVLVNGKKIAGILSEVSFSKNIFNGIVLGIGVNLNLSQKDCESIENPATSLNIEIGNRVDSNLFVKILADNFFKRYELFLETGFISFKKEYLKYSNFIKKTIKIKNPDLQYIGKAIGVNDNGSLKILADDGTEKDIFSGDIILQK